MTRDDLHRSAEARLADHEQRYTPNRRAIVETLAARANPVTLPELLRLRPDLTQSSTYRNLTALQDAEVVRRIVGGGEHAHFELDEHLTAHHHHLVCVQCGSILDVTLDPRLERRLDRTFDDVAVQHGFDLDGHSIELFGRCATCRG